MKELNRLLRLLEQDSTDSESESEPDPENLINAVRSIKPSTFNPNKPTRMKLSVIRKFLRDLGPVDPDEFVKLAKVGSTSMRKVVALMYSVLRDLENDPSQFKAAVNSTN